MSEKDPIANCSEFEGTFKPVYGRHPTLWRVCMSYHGPCVYVWGTTDLEAVQEAAIDFADEQGWCGVFTFLEKSDFEEAASDLGIPWKDSWPDWEDPDFEKVTEQAEADLSTIGHTTLNCQPKEAWGAYTNYEWSIQEVTDKYELEEVGRRSVGDCYGHNFLVGDQVWLEDPDAPEDDGLYKVVRFNGEDVDIEGNGGRAWSDVSPELLEHYDPEKHKPKKTEAERMTDFFFPKRDEPSRGGGGFLGLPSWDKRRGRR